MQIEVATLVHLFIGLLAASSLAYANDSSHFEAEVWLDARVFPDVLTSATLVEYAYATCKF